MPVIAAECEVSDELCDFIAKRKPGPRAFKRSLSGASTRPCLPPYALAIPLQIPPNHHINSANKFCCFNVFDSIKSTFRVYIL